MMSAIHDKQHMQNRFLRFLLFNVLEERTLSKFAYKMQMEDMMFLQAKLLIN